jgi:peptidoglycan/LPS O-acetylase OafA/YrhL
VVVLCWRTYGFTWLSLGTSYAYNAFDTRFDNLAIGCLMAFLLKRDRAIMVADWLGDRFWKPIVTIVLLAVSKDVPNQDYLYGPGFTIDALLLAILLIQFMRLGYGAVWGWLNYRFVVYLGVISYPIYLWHVWGVQAGHKLAFLSGPLQTAAGIVFSCLLAALSYHIVEQRFLALKNRFQALPNDHKSNSAGRIVRNPAINDGSATKAGQR